MKIENCEDDNNMYDSVECNLKPPLIEGNQITVGIENLGIMPEHPLNSSESLLYVKNCQLIFEGVVRSERIVSEYAGHPRHDGFKPPQKVVDGPFRPNNKATVTFRLGGVLQAPLSWVDWEIQCVSFYLEVPDKPVLKEFPV
jgi:hypothetical protein